MAPTRLNPSSAYASPGIGTPRTTTIHLLRLLVGNLLLPLLVGNLLLRLRVGNPNHLLLERKFLVDAAFEKKSAVIIWHD